MNTTEIIRLPIRQLSAQLTNQIAAGEVVERPASIVKELVENSLDAGASCIEIEIVKGGLELIKIRDNGCGIPKLEIPLALQAHCTSKISNFDDLCAIESMGFRGEALASIVSISRFEITSAVESENMAWSWIGGSATVDTLIPASHLVGTSIYVRDIFYNTMARRKFLRSERTEFRHIEDVVKRIALSRFDIEIILKHNNRVVYRLLSATTEDLKIKRLEKLLDKKFIQHALQVSYQASQLSITGWLSGKNYSRGQTDMQYFYVNGRMVKDKVISHALRQVYQFLLPPGRFPAYVLNLDIDAQQVDVNVHPTKHEVRFRQTRLVHDFVNHVIRDSLDKINSASEHHENSGIPDDLENEKVFETNSENFSKHKLRLANIREPGLPYQSSHSDLVTSYTDSNPDDKPALLGEVIGFCKPGYLLSQSSQGMVLVHLLRVEQHLVEQQWLSQFKKQILDIKPFVFPVSIELDKQLGESVERYHEMIQSIGFDLSLQSETTALLRAAPAVLKQGKHEALVRQLLISLQMEERITAKELILLLSRFVELGENTLSMSLQEWNQYLREIENNFSSLIKNAPYKNKLWRILSFTEINKLFQINVSAELQFDN